MFKTRWAFRTAFIALLAGVTTVSSQTPPRSGIYRIQSGTYREVGGFVGEVSYILPSAGQTFVGVTLDSTAATAELDFLSENRRAFYIRLTNGVVTGNAIRFQYLTIHPYGPDLPPAFVDYTVTNSAGNLWLSGSITSAPACCDIPYLFEHIDVRATIAPTATIRAMTGIEVCWKSESNQIYQVQFHTNLLGQGWSDVGAPVQGNGSVKCVVDSVALEQAQRFYRVVLLP